MAGKVGHINIGELQLTFVFRHRYEKDGDDKLIKSFTMWNDWKIGLFYKPMKIVGMKNSNRPKEWSKNLVRQHMIGINFLWFKAWVTICKGGLNIKTK